MDKTLEQRNVPRESQAVVEVYSSLLEPEGYLLEIPDLYEGVISRATIPEEEARDWLLENVHGNVQLRRGGLNRIPLQLYDGMTEIPVYPRNDREWLVLDKLLRSARLAARAACTRLGRAPSKIRRYYALYLSIVADHQRFHRDPGANRAIIAKRVAQNLRRLLTIFTLRPRTALLARVRGRTTPRPEPDMEEPSLKRLPPLARRPGGDVSYSNTGTGNVAGAGAGAGSWTGPALAPALAPGAGPEAEPAPELEPGLEAGVVYPAGYGEPNLEEPEHRREIVMRPARPMASLRRETLSLTAAYIRGLSSVVTRAVNAGLVGGPAEPFVAGETAGVDPNQLMVKSRKTAARRGYAVYELTRIPRWVGGRVAYPRVRVAGRGFSRLTSAIGMVKEAVRLVPEDLDYASFTTAGELYRVLGGVHRLRTAARKKTRRTPRKPSNPPAPYTANVYAGLPILFELVPVIDQSSKPVTVSVRPGAVMYLYSVLFAQLRTALRDLGFRAGIVLHGPERFFFDLEFTLHFVGSDSTTGQLYEDFPETRVMNRFTVPPSFIEAAEGEEVFSHDEEWFHVGQGRVRSLWLSLTSIMLRAVLNGACASAGPFYDLDLYRMYGYSGAALDIEDEMSTAGVSPASRDLTAVVSGIRVGMLKKRLSRSFDFYTLGLSLYSKSPEEWLALARELHGLEPASAKTLTSCLFSAFAFAYEHVSGAKPRHTQAKIRRALLEVDPEATNAGVYDVERLFRALITPGTGYPKRGWPGSYHVRIYLCELSRQLHENHPNLVSTLEFTAGEGEETELSFLATESHIVFLRRSSGPARDPEWFGADAILHHREIEVAPPSPVTDYNYVVLAYDFETLNGDDGIVGDVVEFMVGWKVAYSYEGDFDEFYVNKDPPERISALETNDVIGDMLAAWFRSPKTSSDKRVPNYVVAHNGSGFDHYLVWKHILTSPDLPGGILASIVPGTTIRRGGKLMTFRFSLRRGRDVKTFSMRDTMLYWPMSLDRMGKALSCEVKKGSFPYEEVVSLDSFREKPQLLRDCEVYLDADVDLLAEICVKLDRLYREMFDLVVWQTLTAASVARKYYFATTREHTITCPSLELDRFYRKSFFGGRNEAFAVGSFYASDRTKMWYVDATSLYPSVLAGTVFPVGNPDIREFNPPMGAEETLAYFAENGISHERCEIGGPYPKVAFVVVHLRLSQAEGYKTKPPLAQRAAFKGYEEDGGVRTPILDATGDAPDSRLVFAWGDWEGVVAGTTFEYVLKYPGYSVDVCEVKALHVYEGGMPLAHTVRTLFQTKREIDEELARGGHSAEEADAMLAKRTVVKLMLNSMYGFWAIKVVSNRSYDVIDTPSPSAAEAFAGEKIVSWYTHYKNQTVFEYTGVLETTLRNLPIGMWTSDNSRLRLLKMMDAALAKPWRDVLYVDTDSLHVIETPPAGEPDFWHDVILSDPEASDHHNLGGWTDELMDTRTGKHGTLKELHIGGLKLYAYVYNFEGAGDKTVIKARGYSYRWKFLEREVQPDPLRPGREMLVFRSNYSEAFHELLAARRGEPRLPHQMTLQDLIDLIRGRYSRIVSDVARFFAGSYALGKDEQRMRRKRTLTSLSLVFTKARLLGQPGDVQRRAEPFVIRF